MQLEREYCGFKEYHDKWLQKLEFMMQQLLKVPRDAEHEQEQEDLVASAMKHYSDYYFAKAKLIKRDVGQAFRPIWLSSLERGILWMGGCKPTVAFKLVETLKDNGVLEGISEETVKELEGLRALTRAEERKVEAEMEEVQVGVAADIAGAERGSEEEAEAMKKLVEGAEMAALVGDNLRMEALRGVVDALSPVQAADYLASAAMLSLRLHEWGVARDLTGQD